MHEFPELPYQLRRTSSNSFLVPFNLTFDSLAFLTAISISGE